MRRIKHWLLLMPPLFLAACIKPYDPLISSDAEHKFVVSGRVTDLEGWQEVEVSLSSPIEAPSYIPVNGCAVSILDDQGTIFPLEEYQPGRYRVWMGTESLVRGRAYRVRVITPSGEELVSGFDTMPAGPPIDSVYAVKEEVPTANPAVSRQAMQFYVDLDAGGDDSRYYQWELIETWEYHAWHAVEYYYDGTFHEVKPPDSSRLFCWSTGIVQKVFTLSTKNLTQNCYPGYPLHAVDGFSTRLEILYSLLVRQLAISEQAFHYWEQLRINSHQQGGLYEKQPFAIRGNLENTTRPGQEVLGYFYTASESTRRYFFQNTEGIPIEYIPYCWEDNLGRMGWREFFPWEYPIYYYYNEEGRIRILSLYCIDCTLQGGTTVRPDFWPY